MKNFLRITFCFLALALSATAYCSTTYEACKIEQQSVTVTMPDITQCETPVPFVVTDGYQTGMVPWLFTYHAPVTALLDLQTSPSCTASVPNSHYTWNAPKHSTALARRHYTAIIGHKQLVKHLPYSRHVYTRPY